LAYTGRVDRLNQAVVDHDAHGPGDHATLGAEHAVSGDEQRFGIGAEGIKQNKQEAEFLEMHSGSPTMICSFSQHSSSGHLPSPAICR